MVTIKSYIQKLLTIEIYNFSACCDKTILKSICLCPLNVKLLCLRLYEFLFSAGNNSANLWCGFETIFETVIFINKTIVIKLKLAITLYA